MALSEQIGQKEPVFVYYVEPKTEISDFATAMLSLSLVLARIVFWLYPYFTKAVFGKAIGKCEENIILTQ